MIWKLVVLWRGFAWYGWKIVELFPITRNIALKKRKPNDGEQTTHGRFLEIKLSISFLSLDQVSSLLFSPSLNLQFPDYVYCVCTSTFFFVPVPFFRYIKIPRCRDVHTIAFSVWPTFKNMILPLLLLTVLLRRPWYKKFVLWL